MSDFQPSGKAELGSALQSRCWERCAVLSERERARAAALLCSELRPCCNIPAVLRCRSPLQGVCCSDASLPASAVCVPCVGCVGCVLALRVSPRVGCYLPQLSEVEARPLPWLWCSSAELHQLKDWCWAVSISLQVSLGISHSPSLFLS